MIELTIESLAYGGDGLARDSDGRVVFVPYTIVGEKVQVEITSSRRKWARGRLIEVLDPSSERISPRCQHFMNCGGCHYQHMTYQAQSIAKREILREQLQRIGGIPHPVVEETIQPPSPWNYRNHMRFQVSPQGKLGFRAIPESDQEIVEISECHLPEHIIGELWPNLDVPDLKTVSVRSNPAADSMVILQAENVPEHDVQIHSSGSVVWTHAEGTIVLAGESELIYEIAGRNFRVSPQSFFQVHSDLTEQLVRLTLEGLSPAKGEVILDLYAGVGLFSAFVAQAGATVIAVEQSPWACADFEANLDEFVDITLYEASVEDVLPHLETQPHAAILDPPRRGLGTSVVADLARLGITRLVYVSCDPATLARDAKQLVQHGYDLVSVTPIDLFPQTFHIESVSIWHKSEG
jgi:23S rRNA (uracil1939-C5)-methyltransferase